MIQARVSARQKKRLVKASFSIIQSFPVAENIRRSYCTCTGLVVVTAPGVLGIIAGRGVVTVKVGSLITL